MNRTDVIIIGGGVAGLMAARELAAAGLRVALLERQAIARESSWAGGGILSPLKPWRMPAPVTALCRASQAAYPQLAQTLLEDTGIDPQWLRSGLLFCDCDEPAEALRWAQAHGSECQPLAAEELPRIEPGIRAAARNPLLFPGVAQVRNPRLLRALRQDLARRGVELLEHRPVDAIKIEGGKAVALVCGQERLAAAAYVLAAGAWTGQIMRDSGLQAVPIAPVKGEMLVFDAPPGLLSHMVLSQGRYLIPRKDGKILAGSTVDGTQFNKGTTAAARAALHSFACALLPALRQCRIEKHWAGLRPGSPTGIPSIGPHPAASNLYLNTGHFRNGFVMAPASARLLADHVLGRSPSLAPDAYLPQMADQKACG